MTKYKACISATFEIEFEDNEELDLRDQAHDVFQGMVPSEYLLDTVVVEVFEVSE